MADAASSAAASAVASEARSSVWSSVDTVKVVDPWDAKNPVREPKSELDKEAFLQLLITQMKYQDPLNPMDDQAFLGQMAQFTALEQMVNLNNTYNKTQAYAMMGKNVDGVYTDPVTGETEDVTGLVEAVTTKGSEVYLTVDGKDIPLSTVTTVTDDYFTSLQLDAIYENVSNSRSQELIGKHIQALLIDDEGNVTDYVEGVVDYVKPNGSQSVLMVDGKEVLPGEVTSVSGEDILINKSIINGKITDITIKDGKAYVHFSKTVVDEETGTVSVKNTEERIEKINYIMEAIDFVGRRLEQGSYRGTVENVAVTNGVPFLYINDDDGTEKVLSYKQYLETLSSKNTSKSETA